MPDCQWKQETSSVLLRPCLSWLRERSLHYHFSLITLLVKDEGRKRKRDREKNHKISRSGNVQCLFSQHGMDDTTQCTPLPLTKGCSLHTMELRCNDHMINWSSCSDQYQKRQPGVAYPILYSITPWRNCSAELSILSPLFLCTQMLLAAPALQLQLERECVCVCVCVCEREGMCKCV